MAAERWRHLRDRRRSNRTLAAYAESVGIEWVSLRRTLPLVAGHLGVCIDGLRRSDAVRACKETLTASGVFPPSGYVAPWFRDGTVNRAYLDADLGSKR